MEEPKKVATEPTLYFHAANAAWSAVQWAVIPMPTWAHILVTAVSGALSGIANRQNVVPNNKLGL